MEILYSEVIYAPSYLGFLIVALMLFFIALVLACNYLGEWALPCFAGAIIFAIGVIIHMNTPDTEMLYVDISTASPYEEQLKWEAEGWELIENKGRLYVLERELTEKHE